MSFVRNLAKSLFLVLCLATASLSVAPAYADTAPVKEGLSPTQTQELLNMLTNPAQRDAFVTTLKNLQEAQTIKNDADQSVLEIAWDNISAFGQAVGHQARGITQTIANFRALGPWVYQVWHDSALQHEIVRVCLRVAIVAVGGILLAKLMQYLLRRPRRALEAKGQSIAEGTLADLNRFNDQRSAAQKNLADLTAQETKIKASIDAINNAAEAPPTPEESQDSELAQAAAQAAASAPVPETPQETSAPKNDQAAPDASLQNLQKNLKQVQASIVQTKADIDRLTAQMRQVRTRNHWRKIPCALGRFALDLIGVAMYPLVALLIQLLDPSPDSRTMAAVWSVTLFANVGQTLWVAVLRILLAPRHSGIRIAPLSTPVSVFLFDWLRRIGSFIAWGLTAIIILQSCTLPTSVTSACGKLLGLCVHGMLAFMILGARKPVAQAAQDIAARAPRMAPMLFFSAKLWWIVGLFFDLALWLVWAADIREGYQLVLRLFIRTCLALLASRGVWIVGHNGLARLFNYIKNGHLGADTQTRIARYYPALQKTVSVCVLLLTLLFLAIAWGAPVEKLFEENALGARLASTTFTILLSLLVGVFVWEGANIFIDHQVQKLDVGAGATVQQKAKMARIRTLQPLFRILLLIVLSATIGMGILSELGLNITPLLASASIFGVALGFGSQKLVHDFISGVFLLLENALSVGDAVTLNGVYGLVEKLSLRTVHVRASDGSLNIFPFSSLDKITNYNRGFCRAMISAEVSYDTDVQTVIDIFKEITAGLRADPNYAHYIIDDFQVWGLANFGDSAITISGTVPVIPAGRWVITWEFNRRMYDVFSKRGVNMPYPTRTLDIPSLDTYLTRQTAQRIPPQNAS